MGSQQAEYSTKPFEVEALQELFYERKQNSIPYTLDELFWDVCQHIYLDNDRDWFEIILSASCDRKLKGDPIWLYGIGESGGTKSVMAHLLRERELADDIFMLDKLTPNALVSGKMKYSNKEKKLVPIRGILQHIDGKVLVIKDFTWVLSYCAEKRREIFGQLRTVYDGYIDAGYGTMGKKLQIYLDSGIGLIAFVTPMIDDYTVLESLLGSRFIRVRHKVKGFEEQMELKAMDNFGKEKQIYKQLGWLINFYIRNSVDWTKQVDILDEWKERIRQLAHYVAFMRTQVRGDWWKGQLQAIISEPNSEIATRLVKQFLKFAMILTLLRGKSEFGDDEWKTLLRVAEDTIMPYTRSKILNLIRMHNYKVPTIQEIADELKISRTHTKTTLQLMEGCYILEECSADYKLTDKAKMLMLTVYDPNQILKVTEQ